MARTNAWSPWHDRQFSPKSECTFTLKASYSRSKNSLQREWSGVIVVVVVVPSPRFRYPPAVGYSSSEVGLLPPGNLLFRGGLSLSFEDPHGKEEVLPATQKCERE